MLSFQNDRKEGFMFVHIYVCSKSFMHLLTYLLHAAESFLRSYLVLRLVKKFPALYGTQKFITIFTSARHMSLS